MTSQDDLWSPWSPPGGAPRRDQRREGGPRRDVGRGRAGAGLSRDEIVDAAIAVADAEGPDAVSMRRIAQVLRAGTMSLYWHVGGKEHLISLMRDALAAEIEVPPPSGDWRAGLRAFAVSSRDSLLRHRWVIDYLNSGPAFGPNMLRVFDRVLALLDDLHLDSATAANVVQVVTTYVSGTVLRESQEIQLSAEQAKAGVDQTQLHAAAVAWRERLQATGQFAHVIRILDDEVDPDADHTRAERFAFGLDCLLDGVAARVGGAASSG
jgi:AcrR family transcriptional regulator